MAHSFSVGSVIVKRFDLGETDRVLTVFSKERGKVSVLAKGVKRIVSRRAGSVEIGNHCELYVYEGKNFYILTEVKLLDTFLALKSDLATVKYGYYILELVDRLTAPDEPQEHVFSLLIAILKILNTNPRKIFIRAFELKLLHSLGYLSISGIGLAEGTVAGSEFLDAESLNLLLTLQEGSWSDIATMSMDQEQSQRLEQFLQFRIERIAERTIKSLQFFE
jgi:hypothetical protein